MVLKSIKLLIVKDKLIFFLITLCIVASSLVLNFSYGLYQNFNMIKKEEAARGFDVILSIRDDNIKKSELEQYIRQIESSTNEEIGRWSVTLEKDDIPLSCSFSISNGRFVTSENFKVNLDRLGMITEGTYFTDFQESNGEMVALAVDTSMDFGNQDFREEFPIKDGKITVLEKEYEIIGYQNASPTPIVPFLTIDYDANVTRISFSYDNRITRPQYDAIKAESINFWGERIHFPNLDVPENKDLYLYNTVMFIALIISFIAAINFVILYRYILIKRKHHIAIFRICGCTKFKALRIYLSECFILLVPLYLVSTAAYHFFLLPLLKNAYPNMAASYSILIYLAILGIYLIVSLIILLVMIINEINKSPVTAVKGGN